MTEQEITEKVEAAAKELLAAKNENEQLRQAHALLESQVVALAERGSGAFCSRCQSLQEMLAGVIALALFGAAVVSSSGHAASADLDWFSIIGIGVIWVAGWVLAVRFWSWWKNFQVEQPWLDWQIYHAWQAWRRVEK